MTDSTPTTDPAPSQALSTLAGVLGGIGAVAAVMFSVYFYYENKALSAKISGYTTSFEDDTLILTGGGADFIQPDFIEVTPVWGLNSGVDIAQLEGDPMEFSGGVKDQQSSTIRFNNIVERVCGLQENAKRCDISDPALLRTSIHLLGAHRDGDLIQVR